MTPPIGELDEAARIRRAAHFVEEKQSQLDKAIDERQKDRQAWGRWEAAVHAWKDAMVRLYTDTFWDNIDRLGTGDTAAIEPAITFLEVDPWCFRSGYVKEVILRFLKRIALSDEQATRLRVVILKAIDVGDRREFRGYCKLARHVVDDGLRVGLLDRLRGSDAGQARRSLWVLYALREPLGDEDQARAKTILEDAAATGVWWRVSTWVRPYVRRYGDAEWIDRLLTRAVAGGSDAGTALRLLSAVRVNPSDVQRSVLASMVLRVIVDGGDEDWLESTAAVADSPGFRAELTEAYRRASNPDQRRRAGWAINAIRQTSIDGWPGNDLDRQPKG